MSPEILETAVGTMGSAGAPAAYKLIDHWVIDPRDGGGGVKE
jgi:hypothetical protein